MNYMLNTKETHIISNLGIRNKEIQSQPYNNSPLNTKQMSKTHLPSLFVFTLTMLIFFSVSAATDYGYTPPSIDEIYSTYSKNKKASSCDSFTLRTTNGLSQVGINSWSAAWGDYDNDGYDDLFVPENDIKKPNQLYHNNGDGTFTQITTGDIVSDLSSSVMGKWGDYDNDGYLDLLVTSNLLPENLLYHNERDGTFSKVTKSTLVVSGLFVLDVCWGDYNRDGHLDIIASEYSKDHPNLLYKGDGTGGFVLDSNNVICQSKTTAVGTGWCDYDRDGDIDLFIANTRGEDNQLFRNDYGVFIEITEGPIVNDGGYSVDCAWGDMDNDGDMDLYVVNSRTIEKNNLYINNGDGTFSKDLTSELVKYPANSNEAEWVDYNNDGYLDLYVANDQKQNNHLFRNDQNNGFTKIENATTRDQNDSYGCSWADIDNDGDLDLYIPNTFTQKNDYYRNDMNDCGSANYIDIQLEGCISNSFGIGAQILLKCQIDGKTVWQTKDVDFTNTGTSTYFGIGTSTVIDSIIVRWPSSLISKIGSITDINKKVVLREDCNLRLTGNVFFDKNNNGTRDTGEVGIPDRRILISPGNFLGYTDENGDYLVYVNPGSYNVAVAQSSDLYQSLPLNYGSYSANIDPILSPVASDLDFGLTDKCTNPDLSVNVTSKYFHREQSNQYQIKINNSSKFNNAGNFDLKVILSNNASLAEENYDSKNVGQNTTTYIYKYAKLNASDSTTLFLSDVTDVDLNEGKKIELSVEIEYSDEECTLINNMHDVHTIVSKISEHNNKEVSVNKSGTVTAGLHTYTINYQNVSNNISNQIIIRDTLSEFLKWSTFEMVSSTHNFTTTRVDDVVTWTAEDLNLPDKTDDENASRGKIVFQIYPKDDIQLHQLIVNKAYITFDSDLTLETNEVVSTYEYRTEFSIFKDIVLYPNPNPGRFKVTLVNDKNNLENITQLDIIDLQGRLIHRVTPDALRVDVDISYIAAEVYIIKVYDIYGNITYSKLMKE